MEGGGVTRVEVIASAIANARGMRRGMPPIENILDLLPERLREEVIDEAQWVERKLAEHDGPPDWANE